MNKAVKRIDRFVSTLRMRRQAAEELLRSSRHGLKRARRQVRTVEKGQAVVQELVQSIQQKIHGQIGRVVSRCLDAVFEEPYQFKIDFVRARGKTEARLIFVRDGVELDDPLNEVGGGVIDVASLALRLACIVLSKPRRRRLVVLDEPFRNVRGEANRQRTRRMLEELAEELNVQFVLNTDIEDYRLGTVVEMEA